jgi:caffeoyl-CoA O-methyltransferase
MSDAPKSFHLSSEVHEYLVSHGSPPDAVKQDLIEATNGLGGIAIMQIAPEQGAFMTTLARLMGAPRIIEVGNFTGYSTLCL